MYNKLKGHQHTVMYKRLTSKRHVQVVRQIIGEVHEVK